jgi:anion-transporting  ArsA/GET3 family ATPase
MQETVEAVDELQKMDLPVGSVIVNRTLPVYLAPDDLAKAAEGHIDADGVRAGLTRAGVKLNDADFAGRRRRPRQPLRVGGRACQTGGSMTTPEPQGRRLGAPPARVAHAAPPALDMASILLDTSNRVVVCCGAGGVGKTTAAAAMALRAAEYGRTVVVLTIDPARRLAQALGIDDLGNSPQRVPLGPEVKGELHAMMLDMRRTFDEMVVEYSGPERAQAILDNQFYQTVATSLAGTQEYMAMEKLGQLVSQDKWDLVVVDTPPSRNALDFLDAPKRLGSFMDGRLWRLLLAPGRGIGRLVTGAVGLAMRALSTVLGSQMLADASAFVQSLDSTFGGFREKADRTYALLKRRGTQFVVVSAAEPDALREASFFVDRLSREGMPLAGMILNRTHPTLSELHVERAIDAAEDLEVDDPGSLAAAVLRIHADRGQTAKREVRLLSRFTGANPHVPIVGVPSLPFDVSDLEALRAIADQLTAANAA